MNGRVQRYTMSQFWKKDATEVVFQPDIYFRPDRMIANIESEGLAFISGIYLDESPNSELLFEVDLYNFSIKLQTQLEQEFLKTHNLVGKSSQEIQDYLDDNELSYPKVGQIVLPTAKKYRLVGESKVDFSLVLMGMARS